MTEANFMGQILFGAIGMGAFLYGKNLARFKILLIGIALMAYPWFVSETWLLWTIGGALTFALFLGKE